MKIEKVYASIDAANMKDLLQTFAAKNTEADRKKSKIELGASLIETMQELIPKSINDCTQKYQKFKKMASDAGFPVLGSREFKQALCLCIKNLLTHATPELIQDNDFSLAPSLSAKETNSKLTKVLLLYQLALPMIKQHVVYDSYE